MVHFQLVVVYFFLFAWWWILIVDVRSFSLSVLLLLLWMYIYVFVLIFHLILAILWRGCFLALIIVLLTDDKQAPWRNWDRSECVFFILIVKLLFCFMLSDIVPYVILSFSCLSTNMLHSFTSINLDQILKLIIKYVCLEFVEDLFHLSLGACCYFLVVISTVILCTCQRMTSLFWSFHQWCGSLTLVYPISHKPSSLFLVFCKNDLFIFNHIHLLFVKKYVTVVIT